MGENLPVRQRGECSFLGSPIIAQWRVNAAIRIVSLFGSHRAMANGSMLWRMRPACPSHSFSLSLFLLLTLSLLPLSLSLALSLSLPFSPRLRLRGCSRPRSGARHVGQQSSWAPSFHHSERESRRRLRTRGRHCGRGAGAGVRRKAGRAAPSHDARGAPASPVLRAAKAPPRLACCLLPHRMDADRMDHRRGHGTGG
jgi:hypothetical protein